MILYINLIRTNNLTAKIIHLGELLNSGCKKSYNHCEVGFVENRIRYTSGSREDGTKTVKWLDYLNKYNDRIEDISEYKIELSEQEYNTVIDYINSVEGTKYEYFMFLCYAIKLVTKKWFGSSTSKRLFCVEHCIRAINKTGRFKKLETNLWPNELKQFLDKNF